MSAVGARAGSAGPGLRCVAPPSLTRAARRARRLAAHVARARAAGGRRRRRGRGAARGPAVHARVGGLAVRRVVGSARNSPDPVHAMTGVGGGALLATRCGGGALLATRCDGGGALLTARSSSG